MKLQEIADALGARVVGDGELEVTRAVHPAAATSPQDLALAMDRDLLALLAESPARAAVIAEGVEPPMERLAGCIVVIRPRVAMAVLMELFEQRVHTDPGLHPTAVIAPSATLGQGVSIGPFVTVGPGAVIGDRCRLLGNVTVGAGVRLGPDGLIHPGARLLDRVEIGARVIIHANAVIGSDGFSFVTPEPGSVETAKASGRVEAVNTGLRRINSNGTVVIGDDVEIGANTAVDRGTVAPTRIGRGTKIDNLVQIGHNVEIGEMCMICGNVGIAGSSKIGNRVVLAGGVGVGDHLTVGDDAVVAAMSGVGTPVPPKEVYLGCPAVPRERAFAQILHINRLKSLFADIARLKDRVKALEPRGEKG